MPASPPPVAEGAAAALRQIGRRLRDHRKRLGLSAVVTAEAAGVSRVTLHRIEKGSPSVAMGAYVSAAAALGLGWELHDPRVARQQRERARVVLPRALRLTDYPQLKQLAWQLDARQKITPEEALDIYERNWRHLEPTAFTPAERELLDRLLVAFGRERPLV